MRHRIPGIPHHPYALERRTKRAPPIVEQVRQHREQLLLGRIPRLQEVVVDLDFVDGLDGGVRVRVGGEKDTLGLWVDLDGALEELHAVHSGHALVHQEERRRVSPTLERFQ